MADRVVPAIFLAMIVTPILFVALELFQEYESLVYYVGIFLIVLFLGFLSIDRTYGYLSFIGFLLLSFGWYVILLVAELANIYCCVALPNIPEKQILNINGFDLWSGNLIAPVIGSIAYVVIFIFLRQMFPDLLD